MVTVAGDITRTIAGLISGEKFTEQTDETVAVMHLGLSLGQRCEAGQNSGNGAIILADLAGGVQDSDNTGKGANDHFRPLKVDASQFVEVVHVFLFPFPLFLFAVNY